MKMTVLFVRVAIAAIFTICVLAATSTAATVPFTEDFSANDANWKDAASGPLNWSPAGGPDGGAFVFTTYSFVGNGANDNQTIFRGQDGFDSSGDAFVGNWIADGVATLSAMVRHNAPVPLNYFARLASSANFPGGIALEFAPVLPNTWTEIQFEISPTSPQLVYVEGGDFNSIYSHIGNVQFGVTVPASLAGGSAGYVFDLDKVSIVPEPGAIGLGLLCVALVVAGRIRRGAA